MIRKTVERPAGRSMLVRYAAEKFVTDPTRQEVTMPFVKRKVPVDVDFKNHPAIQSLAKWGPKLRKQIEDA